MGIAEVQRDFEFAKPLQVDMPDGAQGKLSFAASPDAPYSMNNYAADKPTMGFGQQPVPAHSVLLMATGVQGKTRRALKCVLHTPKYPFAIAATGPITVTGNFLVGAVKNSDELPNPMTMDNLHPADVASLSSGDPAVVLEGTSTVAGAVRTPGRAELRGAVVRGGVVHQKVDLPHLDVRSYDTAGRPFLRELAASSPGTVLRGWCRAGDGLDIESGGLELSEAVLYVKGNLHVRGGISGLGAVFVDGNVIIEDGVALRSNQELAVCCTGDLTVRGKGPDTYLYGLLYCQGQFTAEKITLVGAFLSDSGSSAAPLKMDNVTALQSEVGQSFAIKYPLLPFAPTADGRGQGVKVGGAQDFFDPSMNGGQGGFDVGRVDAAHVPMAWFKNTYPNADAGARAMERTRQLPPPPYGDWRTFFTQQQAQAIENLRPQVERLNREFEEQLNRQSLARGQFSLDLNKFIAKESQLRLSLPIQPISWR